MTANFQSFAPLPKLMMNWIEFSLGAETSLEPELVAIALAPTTCPLSRLPGGFQDQARDLVRMGDQREVT